MSRSFGSPPVSSANAMSSALRGPVHCPMPYAPLSGFSAVVEMSVVFPPLSSISPPTMPDAAFGSMPSSFTRRFMACIAGLAIFGASMVTVPSASRTTPEAASLLPPTLSLVVFSSTRASAVLVLSSPVLSCSSALPLIALPIPAKPPP